MVMKHRLSTTTSWGFPIIRLHKAKKSHKVRKIRTVMYSVNSFDSESFYSYVSSFISSKLFEYILGSRNYLKPLWDERAIVDLRKELLNFNFWIRSCSRILHELLHLAFVENHLVQHNALLILVWNRALFETFPVLKILHQVQNNRSVYGATIIDSRLSH